MVFSKRNVRLITAAKLGIYLGIYRVNKKSNQENASILESVKASYRGRNPTRADGIKRRRVILDAVRQTIIASGVQGVKHRAVAEAADVPLAATTYYFPDIHALLHDAFLDFCEMNIHQLQALELKGRELLSQMAAPNHLDNEQKLKIEAMLTGVIYEHVQSQVKNSDDRIIERAFRNESIRNPELATLVNAMELKQLGAISQFFTAFGSTHPDSDARELMALILFLEHSLLAGYVSKKEAEEPISRFFHRILFTEG